MNFNDYQTWAMTKAGPYDGTTVDALVLSALGITGEGGEFADTVKKIAYHKHELTSEARMKMALELGDVLWYVARAAEALALPMDDIVRLNIAKLNARYSAGFSTAASAAKQSDATIAAAMSKTTDGMDLAAREHP